jgi:galactonate dehydratase
MRIVALETLHPVIQPNVTIIVLRSEDGDIGLGETFFTPSAVDAYLHEVVAPALFALDCVTPERAAKHLTPYVGYQGGGVETRALGAVDIALWDLLGQRAQLPVVALLGGPAQSSVPVYNTCAGTRYVANSSRQEPRNWGLENRTSLEDLDGFLNRPGALARELESEGIRGMKVWPFDLGAERTGGVDIDADDLARGVAVVEAIRTSCPTMNVLIELHALWSVRAAEKICGAVAPYQPYWVEDPIRPDAVDALATLARNVDVRIATGETVVGRRGFLPLLERGAAGVVTPDVQWTGGLTEARKIAALADTFAVPVAPHDCTGPVTFAACVHLVASQPNGLIQETVRAFLRTWYRELVEGLPDIRDGRIGPTTEPGLGLRVKADGPRRVSRAAASPVG